MYGLGANALDARAVEKIFKAKGRPQDNPLIVHVAGKEEVFLYCEEAPEAARTLMDAFWPGPLSIILKKRTILHDLVTAGLSTAAFRCPEEKIARELIRLSGVPLAAPSANLSGRPSPTRPEDVWEDLAGRIDAVLFAGSSRVGVESTVLDLTKNPPVLYRPGGVTPDEIRQKIGEIELSPGVLDALSEEETPASPGMKYTHYAPKAKVFLLRGDLKSFAAYVKAHGGEKAGVLCFSGEESCFANGLVRPYGEKSRPEEGARLLFSHLRDLDRAGAEQIFVRYPEEEGVGLAVANRLLRAAGHQVIEL